VDRREEIISLAECSTKLSPHSSSDDEDCLEAATALQDVYGADWSNPSLFSGKKGMEGSGVRDNVTHPSDRIGLELEESALQVAKHLAFVEGDEGCTESDVADDRKLICEAMEGLRSAAETAIVRAEIAEAQLVTQTGTLLVEGKSCICSPDDREAIRKELEEEMKAYFTINMKQVIQAAVDEATAELREAISEVRQIRDSLQLRQAEFADPFGKTRMVQEPQVEGKEAQMMMAMKEFARQVKESYSKDPQMSPSMSTEDARSAAPLEAVHSARSSASSYSESIAPSVVECVGASPGRGPDRSPQHSPQRSFSVPGLITLEPEQQEESCRVRDVVSKFEKILPARGRDQQQAQSPLAPWPFASRTRANTFSIGATPWNTSPSPQPIQRTAHSASLSALH
jgi:DNA-binding transcriptional regulator YiaG